jgi:copper oxidase (laccase) domain-containing protein
VLEVTVEAMDMPSENLLAWLGPAVGPTAFEVGSEVRQAFVRYNPVCESAFTPSPAGRWLANIYELARLRLAAKGLKEIYGGRLCTYTDSTRFFSYRRDQNTGRMASLIWFGAEW